MKFFWKGAAVHRFRWMWSLLSTQPKGEEEANSTWEEAIFSNKCSDPFGANGWRRRRTHLEERWIFAANQPRNLSFKQEQYQQSISLSDYFLSNILDVSLRLICWWLIVGHRIFQTENYLKHAKFMPHIIFPVCCRILRVRWKLGRRERDRYFLTIGPIFPRPSLAVTPTFAYLQTYNFSHTSTFREISI